MKTMKILSATLIGIAVMMGCQKDNNGPKSECETNKTAEVRFSNTSSNPYKIYIDGSYKKTLNGNTFTDYTVKEGTHELKAIQESGYAFYPTEKKTTEKIIRCNDLTFSFP